MTGTPNFAATETHSEDGGDLRHADAATTRVVQAGAGAGHAPMTQSARAIRSARGVGGGDVPTMS